MTERETTTPGITRECARCGDLFSAFVGSATPTLCSRCRQERARVGRCPRCNRRNEVCLCGDHSEDQT